MNSPADTGGRFSGGKGRNGCDLLLERMRKAGISPASLGQEDWKAVFNGGIILPDGRKLMAVREPAGYGMRISGVSPGSARESGMEM